MERLSDTKIYTLHNLLSGELFQNSFHRQIKSFHKVIMPLLLLFMKWKSVDEASIDAIEVFLYNLTRFIVCFKRYWYDQHIVNWQVIFGMAIGLFPVKVNHRYVESLIHSMFILCVADVAVWLRFPFVLTSSNYIKYMETPETSLLLQIYVRTLRNKNCAGMLHSGAVITI